MSRILGGVLRTSKFWIPACALPLYTYNQRTHTRLDENADGDESDALVQVKARAAKRDEILKAAFVMR